MHGVDEGMLGLEASQIMASLHGNGCDETGKLRRDQPSIFAPHWPQRQERLHAAFRQLSGFCPLSMGQQLSTRSGRFAIQRGSPIGGPSVTVLALRVIFARIAHLGDGV
jgi:hypothetical protein